LTHVKKKKIHGRRAAWSRDPIGKAAMPGNERGGGQTKKKKKKKKKKKRRKEKKEKAEGVWGERRSLVNSSPAFRTHTREGHMWKEGCESFIN